MLGKIRIIAANCTSDDFIISRLKAIPEKYYILVIIVMGLLIRGRQYLANRSFWLDEAFLANNIKFRSFSELLEPLEYSQVAPIGFLWAEKLMANMFGLSELSLRFLPFIVSILSIYLLYDLSKILLGRKMALFIAIAFILPLNITYFSSELKQYMTDLFTGLVLFWSYFKFFSGEYNNSRVIFLGILGGILVWISNITPIILTTIGLAIFLNLLKNFNMYKLISIISAYTIWLLSFFTYYVRFIHNHPTSEIMKSYWSGLFMPTNFSEMPHWVLNTFDDMFRSTAGHNEMTFVCIILFFLGIAHVFIIRKYRLLYLLLPFVIHLVLSALQIYPFGSRLVLYLIPFLLFYEVLGIFSVGYLLRSRLHIVLIFVPLLFLIYPFRYLLENFLIAVVLISIFFGMSVFGDRAKKSIAIVLVLFTILYAPALMRTLYYVNQPMMAEDIKPVLEYVSGHLKKDDVVYVYSGSHAAFRYYKEYYFSEKDNCIVGVSSGDQYDKFLKEFQSLKGRVWIIFSHMNPPRGIEYLYEVIPTFEQFDYYEGQGAKAYLVNKK